jgi:hypothetical protein
MTIVVFLILCDLTTWCMSLRQSVILNMIRHLFVRVLVNLSFNELTSLLYKYYVQEIFFIEAFFF